MIKRQAKPRSLEATKRPLSLAKRFVSSCLRGSFALLCLVMLCGAGPATQRGIVDVTVDPRVELLSIIFHLAGNPEYNQAQVRSYADDVTTHFGPFKDHD